MKEISHKEINLATVVRSEVEKLSKKMEFWNVACIEFPFSTNNKLDFSLTDAIVDINPSTDFGDSPDFALL